MIQEWLNALASQGCDPTPKGNGWMCKCPAHEDDTPSLSLAVGDKVPVLATCFAGCEFDAIRNALGIGQNGHTAAPVRPAPPRTAKPPPKPSALPTGPDRTVYHYTTATGASAFAVVRRDLGNGKKSFSQWTPVGDDLWIPEGLPDNRPLYLLPELAASTGKVIVVEGEKCAHAVKGAWPRQLVTCWAGGTNVWGKTDWTPLAGREVSLWADGDPLDKRGVSPGHKAMLGLAAHLHGLGCTVRIALPPVEWDSDVADWIAEGGPKSAAQILVGLLTDYEPEPPIEIGIPISNEPLPDDDGDTFVLENIADNAHYRILGLSGDHIAIRKHSAGRVYERTPEQVQQRGTLITFAPQTWWCGLAGVDKLSADLATSFGDSIIREADRMGQIDQSLFWGRGAVRLDDRRIVYHLGDRLLIDGHVHGLSEDDSRVWLAEPSLAYGDEASDRHMADIAKAVMRYRWATAGDGRRFLGWMVVSIIGGALEWRPHLLLTAPAAQGKTWLLKNVLERLMGPLLTSISDATPAAIAKVTQYASLPIAIDEAEPSEEWVLELLKTLRAASSDFGSRIRVAPNGGVNFQQARFCALLAGTVAPALGRADDTRLSPVNFGPPVADWPAVRLAISAAMEHADAVRYRVIRRAADIVAEADRLTNEMQDLGMDSREAMSSAALTAGWRFWGVDNREVHAQPEISGQSDAGDALLEIMSLRVRLPSGTERSVLQLLADENEADAPVLADLMGIRRDGQGVMIAAKHRGLVRALTRSKWGNADLRKLLLQLDMTVLTANPQRFGGLRERAVRIPQATLAEMGVEFDDAEPDKPTDWEHTP